jgi:hypothetical protein
MNREQVRILEEACCDTLVYEGTEPKWSRRERNKMVEQPRLGEQMPSARAQDNRDRVRSPDSDAQQCICFEISFCHDQFLGRRNKPNMFVSHAETHQHI